MFYESSEVFVIKCCFTTVLSSASVAVRSHSCVRRAVLIVGSKKNSIPLPSIISVAESIIN